jgi:ribosomal protein S18 acetylase RimI-like enzyme
VRIRPAVPDDAEAIERARIRSWRVAYRHVFPPDELDRLPIDSSRWRERLEHGWSEECLVYEDDRGVVGWITTGPSTDASIGEVHGLYVDPDAWSAGAGRALIAAGEAALARSYDEAVLWVLEENRRARHFYEAAGWTTDGLRGTFERFGVSAAVVRYRKVLSSSASRS